VDAGVEIVLEVRDVDAALEQVERAGRRASTGASLGIARLRVVDPDGYYVRVTTR
jgi:hypothetical protein